MINKSCKPGRKACAARRLAGILLTTTMAGTLAAGTPAPMYAATWQENADYIFSILTQRMGYSEAAACGIMANIRCESTFNPHAWNAGGGSYGLCQWTGGRYGRLQSWCGSNGYDYTTIDGQLAYLQYELQNYYPGVENYIRSVENTSAGAYNAGQYYCYHFEAPASRGSVSVYRGGLASGTYWESYRPAEWYLVDGIWHYILRDGTYQTKWLTLEDKTYYFDEDGKRIVGWKNIDGNRYYFDNDGVMASGWQKIDGRSYYFGEDGSLVTGIVRSGDEWFLLDETGAVQASSAMENFAPVWVASAKEEMDAQESDSGDAALLADAEKGSSSSSDTVEAGLSPVTSLAEGKGEATALADDGITAPSLTEERNATAVSAPVSISEKTKGSGSLFDVLEKASVKAVELLAGSSETPSSGKALASSQDSTDPEQQAISEDISEDTSLPASSDSEQQAISEDNNTEDLYEDYSLAARAMQDAANALNEDTEEEESSTPVWMNNLPITFSELSSPAVISSLPVAGIQFNSDDLVAAADSIPEINENAATETAADSEDGKDRETADLSDKNEPEAAENSVSEKPDAVTEDPESENPDEVKGNSASENSDEITENSEADKSDKVTGDSASENPDETGDKSTSENPDEINEDSETENPDEDEDSKNTSSETEEENASVSEKADNKILISLKGDIPDIHRDEMENLVDILREKKILYAETSTGLDITREVTAAFTPSETGEGMYIVTFQVEFSGGSAETTSFVNIIEDYIIEDQIIED